MTVSTNVLTIKNGYNQKYKVNLFVLLTLKEGLEV